MATNRADTLDPALLRPGRLDRKIEFPIPDRRQKRLVFQVCVQPLRQECVSRTGCARGAHLESSLRAASEAGAGHGIGGTWHRLVPFFLTVWTSAHVETPTSCGTAIPLAPGQVWPVFILP